MAEKAVRTGRRVELEPMNPNERRVVHLALQEDNRVETLSKGRRPTAGLLSAAGEIPAIVKNIKPGLPGFSFKGILLGGKNSPRFF